MLRVPKLGFEIWERAQVLHKKLHYCTLIIENWDLRKNWTEWVRVPKLGFEIWEKLRYYYIGSYTSYWELRFEKELHYCMVHFPVLHLILRVEIWGRTRQLYGTFEVWESAPVSYIQVRFEKKLQYYYIGSYTTVHWLLRIEIWERTPLLYGTTLEVTLQYTRYWELRFEKELHYCMVRFP